MLHSKLFASKDVVVIGIDIDFSSIKKGCAIFAKCPNSREEILFDGGIVVLRAVEPVQIESNRMSFLEDDSANLILGCIGKKVERFVVVGVAHMIALSQKGFGNVRTKLYCVCMVSCSRL